MGRIVLVSLDNARNVVAQPTSCPGFVCPKRASACDTCPLSEEYLARLGMLAAIKSAKSGHSTINDKGNGGSAMKKEDTSPGAVPDNSAPIPLVAMLRQTDGKESLEELYSVAPHARGARASVEAKRMKNFCP
jgi:hypothetical protein